MKIENTTETIQELARILRENDLGEIKIEAEKTSICISSKKVCPPSPMHTAPQPIEMNVSAAASAAAPAPKAVAGNIIKSPIIGTFYSSAAPGKPAFAPVGAAVEKGGVICIVESMKLMNEITSGFSGKVAEVFVKDGEAVEYDQPLMRIE